MSAQAPAVRAVWDAVTIPDAGRYDTVHYRVAYPAASPDPGRDPALGIIPPDLAHGPLPVVVLHPNFNCGPELYYWLARSLALQGFAVVTYTWVGELFGGRPGLSTGIDLTAITPSTLGNRTPHLLLAPLLEGLARNPELTGALDLGRVVLGGHSAGGTLSLLSTSRSWHPQVVGAFSYAGHTRAQVPQGFGEDAYLPVPGDVPVLLAGGTHDGVVDAIAMAQTGRLSVGHPMEQTFERAVPVDSFAYLLMVEGADHYSVAEGYDGTTGRGYLESLGPADASAVRALLGDAFGAFSRWCVGDLASQSVLDGLLSHPLLAASNRRSPSRQLNPS